MEHLTSGNCCSNCKTLSRKCAELQNQVKILSEHIAEFVLCDTMDRSVQCNLNTLPSISTECNTQDLINHLDKSVQTTSEEVHNTETLLKASDDLPSIKSTVTQAEQLDFLTLIPSSDLQPYHMLPSKLFDQFDLDELDNSCNYQIQLENRELAYYGEVPYKYGNITHNETSYKNNPYLCHILEHVKCTLPDLDFNSVLITKFRSGNDCLGYHSDDEPEIRDNSYIVTISLGETRTINFKPIDHENKTISTVKLSHGTMYVMTSESQKLFQHSIPRDASIHPRISITLRSLNAPSSDVLLPSVPRINTNHTLDNTATQQSSTEPTPEFGNVIQKSKTLYISSSMFSGLHASKLSSSSQEATVLFYRGATAGQILSRLKNDPKFLSINPRSVNRIYLMCGTNNVDKILNIPFSRCSSFVDIGNVNINKTLLDMTTQEFDQIYHYLHNWNMDATINFVNLLPRVSLARNQVINMLNSYLITECQNTHSANFISTEESRHLFSRNGYRNNKFYSMAGSDHVHLNNLGIVRISKHLKYLAHN